MKPRIAVRTVVFVLLALATGVVPRIAVAIVAGAAPDTPAAHVDANLTSSPWRGVVSVVIAGAAYSGAVVGRRHVLTAAHVAVDIGGANPAAITVQFNASATPVVIGVVRVTPHPSYVSFDNPDLQNDLALLELAADIPAASTVYAWATAAPAAGSVITLVGYGASGQGDLGVTVAGNAAVKRTGRNRLDDVMADAQGVAKLFYADFDGPTAATNFLGGLTLGNGVEVTLAGGDSGSPVFTTGAGNPVLIGVGTFVGSFTGGPTTTGTFGTLAGGVILYAYDAWIRGVIAASGFGGAAATSNDAPLFGELGPGPLFAALSALMILAHRRRVAGR